MIFISTYLTFLLIVTIIGIHLSSIGPRRCLMWERRIVDYINEVNSHVKDGSLLPSQEILDLNEKALLTMTFTLPTAFTKPSKFDKVYQPLAYEYAKVLNKPVFIAK